MSDNDRTNPLANYDPSGVGKFNGNLFGLPFDRSTANLIAIGVPWEVTVSYGGGTANAPARILAASPQLDLFDADNPNAWRKGIYLLPEDRNIVAKNEYYRTLAAKIIERLESGESLAREPNLEPVLAEINSASEFVNNWLYERTKELLKEGKKVAIIGGDHSCPLGYLRALSEFYPNFGILHIDAHADLREAYEGFQYSHASIMFNALKISAISKIVQIGIRDICQAEVDTIKASNGRIVTYSDEAIKERLYSGETWQNICRETIANLPPLVYISFDVDGLDPKLCPHTGTPVPGGLELSQTFYLCREILRSGRQIVGFDICEVGDAEWDGNVGARIFYKLATLFLSDREL
jgi:agmatinase